MRNFIASTLNIFTVLLLATALSQTQASPNPRRVSCPDGKNSVTHLKCCDFFALRDDLQKNLFHNACEAEARKSLRLSFHDAIGYSSALKAQGKFGGGGADGSILTFRDVELKYVANAAISDIVDELSSYLPRYNVTAGDLIQLAAALAVGNCPGGPRLQFLAGRAKATKPGPDGLIPSPADSVDKMLERFRDGGNFSPEDVVALLASHSIAHADDIDPTLHDAPLDSTPSTFDTQFYLETLLKGTGYPGSGNNFGEVESPLPKTGELRMQSDFVLARDNRTSCAWQGFINQQQKMANSFRDSMAKLAINGFDRHTLVDCSEVIPYPNHPYTKRATFPPSKSSADIEQACSSPFPNLAPHCKDKGTPIPRPPHHKS